jgi:predicted metal-dependent HD superfamily phosphohydrolase
MNARDLLSRTWRELAARYACEASRAQVVLHELVAAYCEPHRHYHTIEHIAALLRQMQDHGQSVVDRDGVTLAMLFHDVVYDPRRNDNEEKSAHFAHERLALVGFHDRVVAKVERYIHATKHGQDLQTDDPDLAVLLDLDLSTLGVAPAEYRVYAQAIRREYSHVPDELYRTGRRQMLRGFLGREQIYRTDRLHALWEERARANISAEMAELA